MKKLQITLILMLANSVYALDKISIQEFQARTNLTKNIPALCKTITSYKTIDVLKSFEPLVETQQDAEKIFPGSKCITNTKTQVISCTRSNELVNKILSLPFGQELLSYQVESQISSFGMDWLYSIFPSLNIRMIPLKTIAEKFQKLNHPESPFNKDSFPFSSFEKNIIDGLSSLSVTEFSNSKRNEFLNFFKEKTKISSASSQIQSLAGIASKVLCPTSSGVIGLLQCADSLDVVVEHMKTENDPPITAIPAFMEVLSTPGYIGPIKRVAIKLMNSVYKYRIDGLKSYEANLFDDVVSEFTKDGFSLQEAQKRAINVLGIYGARGSNIRDRITQLFRIKEDCDSQNCPLKFSELETIYQSLIAITNSISVLDGYYSLAGKIYSYPKNVKSSCDTGKSYHFWLGAYLSYTVAKIKGNYYGARDATYLSAIGYQMISSTVGRHPDVFFYRDSLDMSNNKTRLDLAQNIAGADFGARLARNMKIDISIDIILRDLILNAGIYKAAVSEDDAIALKEFYDKNEDGLDDETGLPQSAGFMHAPIDKNKDGIDDETGLPVNGWFDSKDPLVYFKRQQHFYKIFNPYSVLPKLNSK